LSQSDHGHEHRHPAARSGPRFIVFCLVEFIGGIATLNSALVTSALHDLFDGISMSYSGVLDERWARRKDHKSYCTRRGQLGIANALVGPLVSALGLLVEHSGVISRTDMLVAVIIGSVSLGLNSLGIVETLHHHSRLKLGYLAHFAQDAIGSVVVIVSAILAYSLNRPRYVWFGSLIIVGVTLAIGLIAALHTYWMIHHRAENHDHKHESPEEHRCHSQSAAS
jgi:Co/Zn/Cd efflux system component